MGIKEVKRFAINRVIAPAAIAAVIGSAVIRDSPGIKKHVYEMNKQYQEIGEIVAKSGYLDSLPKTRISFKESISSPNVWNSLKKYVLQYVQEAKEAVHLAEDQQIKTPIGEDYSNKLKRIDYELDHTLAEMKDMQPNALKRYGAIHIGSKYNPHARGNAAKGGAAVGVVYSLANAAMGAYRKRREEKGKKAHNLERRIIMPALLLSCIGLILSSMTTITGFSIANQATKLSYPIILFLILTVGFLSLLLYLESLKRKF